MSRSPDSPAAGAQGEFLTLSNEVGCGHVFGLEKSGAHDRGS